MTALLDEKRRLKLPPMEELAKVREELRKDPRLVYLFVELTEQCNLNCLHCGSRCEASKNRHIDDKLLISALETVAEDFPMQSVMLCLTGGEPLLHPKFYSIVSRAVELGFPWGITTNAVLIGDDDCRRLRELGLQSITVSVDGLRESHERLRRTPGCFDRTINAVKRLTAAGIPVQVTTVIHKQNIGELEQLYSLMKSLGVFSWRIVNIEPIGRALDNRSLLLSRGEMTSLLDFIREKRYSADSEMDVCFGCSHYLSFDYEHELRDNYFICGAGLYVGSILVNGDIASCLDIERRPELVQGNIAADRFSDVWFDRFEIFRRDRSALSERCRDCSERRFCAGDSMHTWDFERSEPLLCFSQQEGEWTE